MIMGICINWILRVLLLLEWYLQYVSVRTSGTSGCTWPTNNKSQYNTTSSLLLYEYNCSPFEFYSELATLICYPYSSAVILVGRCHSVLFFLCWFYSPCSFFDLYSGFIVRPWLLSIALIFTCVGHLTISILCPGLYSLPCLWSSWGKFNHFSSDQRVRYLCPSTLLFRKYTNV